MYIQVSENSNSTLEFDTIISQNAGLKVLWFRTTIRLVIATLGRPIWKFWKVEIAESSSTEALYFKCFDPFWTNQKIISILSGNWFAAFIELEVYKKLCSMFWHDQIFNVSPAESPERELMREKIWLSDNQSIGERIELLQIYIK